MKDTKKEKKKKENMNNESFDESSYNWRKNKIYLGKGIFRYKCTVVNCNNILYAYTTENKYFDTFASSFDYLNKNNPKKHLYCEEHLIEGK